jgi:hypothetical protein
MILLGMFKSAKVIIAGSMGTAFMIWFLPGYAQ